MEDKELKGCPFCGGDPIVSKEYGKLGVDSTDNYIVKAEVTKACIECNTCGCEVSGYADGTTSALEAALDIWETRVVNTLNFSERYINNTSPENNKPLLGYVAKQAKIKPLNITAIIIDEETK